jgi:adenine deaminase
MVNLGRQSGFKFFFGAPSCVPATGFETAGAELTANDIRQLFEEKSTAYLAEMMNYPAVLSRDPLVMDKIEVAKSFGLPIDGHAPGLKGEQAARYASAGITTDHECTSRQEALDKTASGMHIIIREGSAAKNYDALHPLLTSHPDQCMLCSDDKHPDELLRGHINQLVTRSLDLGHDMYDVLRAACIHPVIHYQLPVGTMQPDEPADFIMVDNLTALQVLSTWIDGVKVFDGKDVYMPSVHIPVINQFGISSIHIRDVALILNEAQTNIIVAIDGAIVTEAEQIMMAAGKFESDTERDILKIVVVNRYLQAPVAKALIKGFGLKQGAIASSVAHDSHNIVAVGASDADLVSCINQVIGAKGGISASQGTSHHLLPLPVGGLMSADDAMTTGHTYEKMDHFVRHELGSSLKAPYMTLSFMALLVIPSLKLSDQGLFDGNAFRFVPLQP